MKTYVESKNFFAGRSPTWVAAHLSEVFDRLVTEREARELCRGRPTGGATIAEMISAARPADEREAECLSSAARDHSIGRKLSPCTVSALARMHERGRQ